MREKQVTLTLRHKLTAFAAIFLVITHGRGRRTVYVCMCVRQSERAHNSNFDAKHS